MSPADPGALDAGLLRALVRAAQQGTPCYVTDLVELDRRALRLRRAFPGPWLRQYSLKANPLPAIVARLAASGMGANAVSGGEWAAAEAAGLSPQRISLEGIGKTDLELARAATEAAAGRALLWVTLESPEETAALARVARDRGLGASGRALDVLLRLNPGLAGETRRSFQVGAAGSKFGMAEEELLGCARELRRSGPGVRVRGVHVHVGSQLAATRAWVGAAAAACCVAAELGRQDPNADTVDLGGGFPSGPDGAPGPDEFRAALEARLERDGLALPRRPAVEPGRFLIASAGWLVTRVLHVRARQRPQVVVDASLAELIRPALYGARHELAVVDCAAGPDAERSPTSVEGAVCEGTDTFGVHELPPLRRGDVLAFAATGAYVSSMASHYNGRPRPPELLLDEEREIRVARPARDFVP